MEAGDLLLVLGGDPVQFGDRAAAGRVDRGAAGEAPGVAVQPFQAEDLVQDGVQVLAGAGHQGGA